MYRVIYSKENKKWLAEHVTKAEAHGKTYETLSEADEVAKAYNGGTTLVCKDCGREFSITKKEAEWYTNKDYKLPKRCPNCRFKRRQVSGKEKPADA